MVSKEKSVTLNFTASCLNNNLSVLTTKTLTIFAVVHRSSVLLYMISPDGKNINHRQISCKEPHGGQTGPPTVTMGKLVQCAGRDLLVITSTRGLQIFDADGSAMLHWHSLRSEKSGDEVFSEVTFMRGIAAVGIHMLCVGTSSGQICLFSVATSPSKVTVTLNAEINAHPCAIFCLDSSGEWLASGDENGGVRLWQLMGDKLVSKTTISKSAEPADCWPVNAVLFHDNAASVFVAYGSGLIRVFDTRSGKIQVEANAHARSITAADITGDWLITVSEDTICRLWKFHKESEGRVSLQHVHGEVVMDQFLVGCSFIGDSPDRMCLTAFDSSDLIMMRRK